MRACLLPRPTRMWITSRGVSVECASMFKTIGSLSPCASSLFTPDSRVLVCSGGGAHHSVLVVGERERGLLGRALMRCYASAHPLVSVH